MKFIFSILLSILSVVCSYGEAAVWKISKGNNTLYLGGTIHLLRESDYPLPKEFNDAFENSNILVFESSSTPLDLLYGEEFQFFLQELNQFNELANSNEKIKLFAKLANDFQVLTHNNEKVYQVFSDPDMIGQLTEDEREVFMQIYNISQEIQSMSTDEDIMSYVETAQLLMPKIEANKEYFDIFMNPEFLSLETIVDENIFSTIKLLCDRYSLSLSDISFLNPYFAYNTFFYHIISQFCEADGVDNFFEKKATENSKRVEYLEDAVQTLLLISNSGSEYGSSYHTYLFEGLDDEGQLKDSFDKMVQAWRKGTEDNDILLADKYEMENFPNVYKTLIKDRNNAWMPKIENYLETTSGVFILVGFAHMHGPDGLLTQLSKKGYTIEQL